MVVVNKFGGAAMADGTSILHAARIVCEDPRPSVTVASAMFGVTDRLARVLDALPREDEIRPFLHELKEKHLAVLDAIASRTEAKIRDQRAHFAIQQGFERLERLLFGIVYTGELSPRVRDLVLSHGERLSAPLLAAAMRAHGAESLHMEADVLGLRSLGPYQHARPDLAAQGVEVPKAVQPHLDAGVRVVVTGFFGVNGAGETTLFGRGGSDFVATLVGRALDAEEVILWKDVPGFLSADPRSVADATLVEELGFDEAAELAQLGAKVLHPRCVEPLMGTQIPVQIRSFQSPTKPGSVLRFDAAPAPRTIRGIARRDDVCVLRLEGPGLASNRSIGKRIFDALHEAQVNVRAMSTSQSTMAIVVDAPESEAALNALSPEVGGVLQHVSTLPGRCLVGVVGRGLGDRAGSAAQILGAVASAGISIEMISLGASPIALDLVLRQEDASQAVKSIHEAFLEDA